MRMIKPIRILLLLLLLAPAPAMAQGAAPTADVAPPAPAPPAAPAGGLTAEQIRAALSVLESPAKRTQMIEALQAMAKALPSAAPAAAPVKETATPAAPAPLTQAAAAKTSDKVSLTPGGLGAAFLEQSSAWVAALSGQIDFAVRTATQFPALVRWLGNAWSDPLLRATVVGTIWRLALVFAAALAAEWALRLALARLLARLTARSQRRESRSAAHPTPLVASQPDEPAPEQHTRRLLRRLPLALGRFLLELVPLAGFAVIAALILGTTIVSSPTTRLVIVGVVNAYLIYRGSLCVAHAILSSDRPALRLLRLSDRAALYAETWTARLLAIAVFGGAAAQVALLLGLKPQAHTALVKLIALTIHILLAFVVLQCREPVARRIRARADAHGSIATLRNVLARRWHDIAIFFLVVSWVAWAVQIKNGFTSLIDFFIAALAVLIVARLVAIITLGAFDRLFQIDSDFAKRYPRLAKRTGRYYRPLRATISGVIGVFALVVMLQAWGINAFGWFTGRGIGSQMLSAVITIALAAAAAVIVWEAANVAIDQHLTRLAAAGQQEQYARLRTLLPILRTALLVVILTVVGLTALSEIGVNIAPLLAGAGIVGIAVGFGAQKLVQDLITGLFLLLENAMQVGDWIIISGGLSGSVENLSIRTMRLRAGDGSVHIIPFSSVTTVTNTNRGIGNAAVKVSIARQEDPDRVSAELMAIAQEMRQDPTYQPMMLGDLSLWGVTKVGAWAVTIEGQIACTAGGRWPVEREFNRRLKKRFDELQIRLADPLP